MESGLTPDQTRELAGSVSLYRDHLLSLVQQTHELLWH
jgi:hypothetical protein